MCKVDCEKALAVMVVFGEAVRPKGRLEFGKMQIVEFANVCVDVGAHDEF